MKNTVANLDFIRIFDDIMDDFGSFFSSATSFAVSIWDKVYKFISSNINIG